jgi:hypothetical protein
MQAALAYLAAWGLAGLAVTYYYDADDLQARPARGRVAAQAAASRQAAAGWPARRAMVAGAALPSALLLGLRARAAYPGRSHGAAAGSSAPLCLL